MDFKKLDFKNVKKYLNPKSADDLNRFLENLPQNAGNAALIAAAIAWGLAAALGLYTSIQTQSLIELRAELKETEALKPIVPEIKDISVAKSEVEAFVEKAKKSYGGLNVTAKGSIITITANNTSNFTEFREALGHVQNGGANWRVTLDKLCVGRECDKTKKLVASLKINKVEVSAIEQNK